MHLLARSRKQRPPAKVVAEFLLPTADHGPVHYTIMSTEVSKCCALLVFVLFLGTVPLLMRCIR